MNIIFNKLYLENNIFLFSTYLVTIALIIIVTIILVKKEMKRK